MTLLLALVFILPAPLVSASQSAPTFPSTNSASTETGLTTVNAMSHAQSGAEHSDCDSLQALSTPVAQTSETACFHEEMCGHSCCQSVSNSLTAVGFINTQAYLLPTSLSLIQSTADLMLSGVAHSLYRPPIV
ncbi:hypothetical protein [Vibrio breoganii]|uniref:hypothetical protein n=1 Tax=Vibrio breoganii TaxID=553239 RepID=UPI000C821C5E|nr:hypothetical protein [Vibrio breoganii]